jgi:5-methylcytosine-specific restriction endonuclease McrA
VVCGKVGEVWTLEKDACDPNSVPHFNLYTVVKNKGSHKDGLTLMTTDHIVPLAAYGSSTQDNLQTMCCNCNHDKGCSLDWHGGQRPQPSHRALTVLDRQEMSE